MTFDLAAVLPMLLPRAIAWAEVNSGEILASGLPLNTREISIARAVGVASPERIRIMLVETIPLPQDAELKAAALGAELFGPDSRGLTLGYGIYIVQRAQSDRLLAHECRHVYQYEWAGSIAQFLPVYLQQIDKYGYANAPFEVEARQYESTVV